MRSSRLYAAKLNSMPKLEFAISESPTKPAVSRCQLAHLSPPVPPPSSPFLVLPCCTSLISGIDRKYKVVIPELMYLTLAAYRKVPPRSAKWIREREWIVGYCVKDLSLLSFSLPLYSLFFSFFLFSQLANLRETGAGGASPATARPVAGEVA